MRPPPRPRRHHHHGKASHARIGLAVIFVLSRLLDFLYYVGTPPEYQRALLATLITSGMWSTTLLIAIGYRKSWARLFLLAILALSTIGSLVVIPEAFDFPALWTPLIGGILVHGGSFAWLGYSRDVRRLVGRDRD